MVARAHHVERYAREGDMDAVAALQAAGLAADPSAPASAAHWFEAALRLVGEHAPPTRLGLLVLTARALSQTGEFGAARDALLEALRLAPPDFPLRGRMISACATMERLLGRHAEARTRVERALDALPDRGVPDAVFLIMELAADAFFQTDFERMWEWTRKGLAIARTLDEPPVLAAMTGAGGQRRRVRGPDRRRARAHRPRRRRCSTRCRTSSSPRGSTPACS